MLLSPSLWALKVPSSNKTISQKSRRTLTTYSSIILLHCYFYLLIDDIRLLDYIDKVPIRHKHHILYSFRKAKMLQTHGKREVISIGIHV